MVRMRGESIFFTQMDLSIAVLLGVGQISLSLVNLEMIFLVATIRLAISIMTVRLILLLLHRVTQQGVILDESISSIMMDPSRPLL